MPVLVDLSRGSQAVHHTHEIRSRFPLARVFAVADPKHPALTTDAVLARATDVFPRPLGGRSAAAVAGLLPNPKPGPVAVPAAPCVRSEAMRTVMTIVGTRLLDAGRPPHPRRTRQRPPVPRTCDPRRAERQRRAFRRARLRLTRRRRTRAPAVRIPSRHEWSLLRQRRIPVASGGRRNPLPAARHRTASAAASSASRGMLRDGEVLLAGNGHRVSLDVRPIAGVEAGFDRAADEGRVRDDLARVLSIIGIDMPPLRQRREDIPAIARDLLRDICALKQRPPRSLSRPALALLAALPWHGNIIELRALLESIVNGPQTARTIELDDVVSRLHLNGSPPVPRGAT